MMAHGTDADLVLEAGQPGPCQYVFASLQVHTPHASTSAFLLELYEAHLFPLN